MKVQEKKTQKGSSYGIIKFSDLSNVFELFIFSEIFEANRNNLKEGNSIMITLIKNYTDESKIKKRINVKKMISLKELIQQPIPNLTFKFSDIDDLKKLQQVSLAEGNSEIKILLDKNNKTYTFLLKNKRKLDNRLLNTLDLLKYVVID